MSTGPLSTIRLPRPLLLSLWILVAAITYRACNRLDADYDLWWHIVMGSDMLARAAIERFDLYSFTAAMEPVLNHEWLSEVIMTLVYSAWGETGLILWRHGMTLVIILLALNLARMRSRHDLSRIVVILCFVLVLSPGISFRVHLFTMLFLLILITMIYMARDNGRLPRVLPVGLLFLLWSNLHGGFILGLLVWYIYAGEALVLKGYKAGFPGTVLLVFVPLFVTLVNPYGIDLWRFIVSELTNPFSSRYISEWQRFSFEARELPFFGVCLLTWFSYFVSAREKDVAETCVLALASLMGCMAVRHTPLFVILTFAAMALHVDGLIERILKAGGTGATLSQLPVYIVSIVFGIIALLFVLTGTPERCAIAIDDDPLPVQSVAFIKTNNLQGNLWVPLHWGGYVLYHLYPDIKVSIDGRWAMVYPRDVMKDTMTFAYEGWGKRWKEILERYNATFALVETANPAFLEMERDRDWEFIFREKECGLLARRTFMESLDRDMVIPGKQEPRWP